MELYFFEAGVLKSQKQYFTLGTDVGKPFTVPVPFLLIKHPRGIVLFDTGNAPEVVDGKHEHWGDDVVAAYNPVMTKDQCCVNAIQKVGVKPEDVKYVILSHLHLDHAGCVGHFPNAKYMVHREELRYAYVPDHFMKAAYIRKDFDKPVEWVLLDGWHDNMFDLFGDGQITTVFTPGHTPGHQSLLLRLPNMAPLLFAADACYTMENIEDNRLPGLAWNFGEVANSIERMKRMRETLGAQIIPGHDPEAWKKLPLAPECYCPNRVTPV